MERTCDHVVILREGSVVLSESMETLRSGSDEWEVELLTWTSATLETLAGTDVREQKNGILSIRCSSADKNALLRRLLETNADIGLVRRARSLEDLYMQYAGGTSSG